MQNPKVSLMEVFNDINEYRKKYPKPEQTPEDKERIRKHRELQKERDEQARQNGVSTASMH